MSLLKFFAGQIPKWETMSSPTSLYDTTGPLTKSGTYSRGSDVMHLTGTTFVHAYREMGGTAVYCQAFTISADSSVTWGTPLQTGDCIDAEGWQVLMGGALVRMSDTQFVILYRDSGGKVSTRVCTVSGVTLSSGSELLVGFNTNCYAPMGFWTGTHLLVMYYDDSNTQVRIDVCTISGTTITYVNRYTAFSGYRFPNALTPIPGSNNLNLVLSVSRGDSGNVDGWYLRHVTVNPSTGALTFGTQAQMMSAKVGVAPNAVMFSATEGLGLIFNKTDTVMSSRKFTLSGTTFSLGTANRQISSLTSQPCAFRNAHLYDAPLKKFLFLSGEVLKVFQYDWNTESYTTINTIDILPYARSISQVACFAVGGDRLVASLVTYSGTNYYNSLAII